MNQLNYHHLYYFYITAKQGSIANAARELHLTPQTISSQISALEKYFDIALFNRVGKRLILSEPGQKVFSYAGDIFNLGDELLTTLKYQRHGNNFPFYVGITDVIPKVLAFDLFRSCLDSDFDMRFIVKEGDTDSLLADMDNGKLELILSDRPLLPGHDSRAYSHLIGESGLTFLSGPSTARSLRDEFPASLNNRPFLIQGDNSSIKMALLAWFETMSLEPNIIGEFEDSALIKLFGEADYGCFCIPQSIEQHVMEHYKLEVVGRTDAIKAQYYLISPERKLKHPAVLPLLEQAKQLFSESRESHTAPR